MSGDVARIAFFYPDVEFRWHHCILRGEIAWIGDRAPGEVKAVQARSCLLRPGESPWNRPVTMKPGISRGQQALRSPETLSIDRCDRVTNCGFPVDSSARETIMDQDWKTVMAALGRCVNRGLACRGIKLQISPPGNNSLGIGDPIARLLFRPVWLLDNHQRFVFPFNGKAETMI